jgi:hypothetical protein
MSYPDSFEYKELLTQLRDTEDRSVEHSLTLCLIIKALLLIGRELNGIRIRMK